MTTPFYPQIYRADEDHVDKAAAMIDALPLLSMEDCEAVQNPALQRAFLAIEVTRRGDTDTFGHEQNGADGYGAERTRGIEIDQPPRLMQALIG